MKNKIKNFLETLEKRHSDYTLTNGTIISDKELVEFVEKCIYYHPSAFNVQSTRMVMLFGDNCYKLWDHVINALPSDFPKHLIDELKVCCNSHAVILFFDDENITKEASDKYHMPLENFESWALQSMAMLQCTIWNGLTYLGYGVNIQHFNNELEDFVKKEYKLPENWKLLAQTNIGLISGKVPKRTRLPINQILKIIN